QIAARNQVNAGAVHKRQRLSAAAAVGVLRLLRRNAVRIAAVQAHDAAHAPAAQNLPQSPADGLLRQVVNEICIEALAYVKGRERALLGVPVRLAVIGEIAASEKCRAVING